MIPLAFACLLLAYVESVSAARTLAQAHKYEIDARQELLGLGAANLAAALFQAYPVAGGLSQSSVNDKAGARTPLALVFASVTIGVCLLFLTGLLANLPTVVLAAIVLVAVKGLVNVRELRHVWRVSRFEFGVSMVAFAAVLLLGILDGVMVAAVVSLLLLIRRTAHPHVAFLGRIPGTRSYSDLERSPDNEAVPGALLVRVEAALLYFNVEHVREAVWQGIRSASRTPPDGRLRPLLVAHGRPLGRPHARDPAGGACRSGARSCGSWGRAPSVRDILRAEGLEERVGPIDRRLSLADVVDEFQGEPTNGVRPGGGVPMSPKAKKSQATSSPAERYAAGKALRKACPRESHGTWKAPAGRAGAVEMVLAAEKGRMPELLPLRHGRMVRSAFTFYRGSALPMAADLATTPVSGLRVQCCGDAHLSNFGGFATPERRIIFSINDLDETLPAPWEWDVKRLGASFVVACRDAGHKDSVAREVVTTCICAYREAMAGYGKMRTLEVWYESLEPLDLLKGVKDPAIHKRIIDRLEKEVGKSTAEEIFPKLAEHKGELPVIRDQLPTIFHAEGHPPGEIQRIVRDAMAVYRATLSSAYQSLFDRYELRDAAIKVVGIGSVGTSCWVLLFTAGEGDPLFLQVKEARPSVLEAYAGKSTFPNHGQRVVNGLPAHAAVERHVPRMEPGAEARLLRPPAPRRQDQRPRGDVRRSR